MKKIKLKDIINRIKLFENNDFNPRQLTNNQIDYLTDIINNKFPLQNDQWYVQWVEEFPEDFDGNIYFIYCNNDNGKKHRTFRAKYEFKDIDIDGSLSSHERPSKLVYKSEE